MNTIRNWVTLAVLTMVAFALCGTGARAQDLRTTYFGGTFNLPFEAQWGRTILPAGEYNLYYGRLIDGGANMVEVMGKENRRPRVLILSHGVNDATTTRSALVCVRQGGVAIVRALEMPQIGQAVHFNTPRGTRLTAKRSNGNKNVELAEGPMLIQRIPIKLNGK
jgi:hypothetical protein